MASATFTANLTFTPPASNTVSHAFSLKLDYSAVSLGTIDVPKGSTSAILIPFGGATAGQGVVVKNNLDVDVKVEFNDTGTTAYSLASGGMFMHWAPDRAAATNLGKIELTPAAAPAVDGTIEYVVLGE